MEKYYIVCLYLLGGVFGCWPCVRILFKRSRSHSVTDFIIIKICLWLTRVPHRDFLTARSTSLGKVLHCLYAFARTCFLLLAVCSHFGYTFKVAFCG